MKYSIRVKLCLLMVLFISGTFIIYFFINTTFLEMYYINEKQTTLENLYYQINDLYGSDEEVESVDKYHIAKMCEAAGASLLITDSAGREEFAYGTSYILNERLQYIIFSGNVGEDKIIKVSDKYVIQTTVDSVTSSHYLEMWGTLDSGEYFITQMAYEGVQESASISNRFFGYVGSIVIVVSSMIMLIISRKFLRPILDLAHIAERMSNLDFNVKYEGKGTDEIGVLGNSINLLSRRLESNISSLKAANIELKKDLDKKTQADEMRKEFLSNVSHELKSPIALIQGYAEGLKESINEDPESMEFYCDVIMDEANKMNNIVKKLLSLNQIEFGKTQLNLERFDIISVINGLLNSSSILIKQKEVTVYFDDRISIYVWSDEFQTEEILMNYISNALNHVDENKIIRINATQIKNIVRVSVFNSGKHIPEEDLDKIWEKFYKVDKARTREYGGSGIGLSIVKAIQESFNKDYGVNNVEGGVEFWFDIDAES